MSVEDAAKFLHKLKTDPHFRAEVRKASEEVINVAKAQDLKFTREELRTVLKEHWSKPDDDDNVCVSPFSKAPGF